VFGIDRSAREFQYGDANRVQSGLGAHWTWQYLRNPASGGRLDLSALFAVNVLVTLVTMVIGLLALYSGIRRRFPRYASFVGHSRFSSYLTIAEKSVDFMKLLPCR